MGTFSRSFFRLIDGRSDNTDVIKVMSHLKDVGTSVIKHNKIAFHMLANSLADVVAEEAAWWLLPDMKSEQKAKRTERNVWQRGWLWYKLTSGPNAKRRATSTNLMGCWSQRTFRPCLRSGNWWERSPTRGGLRCQACNLDLGSQAIQFLEQDTLCSSRQSSKDVIASVRAKKRLHSIAFSSHLADDSSVFRADISASDIPAPVPTEKQIISELNHGMDTPTVSNCTRPHDPADWTHSLALDMDTGDGVVGKSLCGLDPSAVQLQSNLDDLTTDMMLLPTTFHSRTSVKKRNLLLGLHLSRTQCAPAGNDVTERHPKRHAKSLKLADRVAKRKLMALPGISFAFAEQLLKKGSHAQTSISLMPSKQVTS